MHSQKLQHLIESMLGESVLNSEIYIDDYNVPCWNRRKHNGVVNCHISCNEALISNTSSPIKLQKKIKNSVL